MEEGGEDTNLSTMDSTAVSQDDETPLESVDGGPSSDSTGAKVETSSGDFDGDIVGCSGPTENEGSNESHEKNISSGRETMTTEDTPSLGVDEKMDNVVEDSKTPPPLVEEPSVANSAGVTSGLDADAPSKIPDDADVTPFPSPPPEEDGSPRSDVGGTAATDNDASSDDNAATSSSATLIAPIASSDAPPASNNETTAAATSTPNTVPEIPRERIETPPKTTAYAIPRTTSTGSTTSSILKNPLKKKKKKKKNKDGTAASSAPPPQSLPFPSGSTPRGSHDFGNEYDRELAGVLSCDGNAPLLLLTLPVDSLHCIASFLSTADWSNMSLASRGANRACREVFRRARMHGYRCATEVVMAWMRGQHADARELSALYIKNGVPIYPISLGHSYHTLTWRMGIEAKEMEAADTTSSSDVDEDGANNSDNESSGRNNNTPKVDKFYSDRYEARGHEGYYLPSMTYLEEKSFFWKFRTEATVEDNNFTNMHPGRRHSLTNGMSLRPPPPTIPGGANAGPPRGVGGPMLPPHPMAMGQGRLGFPDGPNFGGQGGLQRPPAYRRTLSSNALDASHYKSTAPQSPGRPKISICVHRHLADQHLLGLRAVDDEAGTMKAASISLAADFFHPHLVAPVHTHSLQSPYDRRPYQEPGVSAMDNLPSPYGAGQHIPAQPPMEPGTLLPNGSELDPTVTPAASAVTADEDGPLIHAEPNLGGNDEANETAGQPVSFATAALTASLQEQPMPVRPPASLHHSVSFGGFPSSSQDTNELQPQPEYSILSDVSLDVYSCSSYGAKSDGDSGSSDAMLTSLADGTNAPSPQRIQLLLARFKAYQRRLDSFLSHFDSVGFEDCLLDFWDEFFPLTAGIHFYDRHSPVPRMSGLHRFLTKPCPKAVGIVQCEIERIKISSKKKGVNVKGRLFPTYEYRLFIRDRRHGSGESPTNAPGQPARRDTVLMTAKNRGRNHQSISGAGTPSSSSKRGVNNFYLCLPQKPDAEKHFQSVNDPSLWKKESQTEGVSPSGGVPTPSSSPPIELGRLQSNFIGTEFQIFSPSLTKRRTRRSSSGPADDESGPVYTSEEEADTDSNYNSDNIVSPNSRSRKKRGLRRLSRRPSFGRRGSSYGSEDDDDETSSRRSDPGTGRKSRRGSWPSLYGAKQSRTNRRAIANEVNSPDGSSIVSMSQPIVSEEETGAITYTANLLGNRPRIMDVCIPKVLTSGVVSDEWRRYSESSSNPDESRMLNRFKVLQQRLDNPDGGNNAAGGNNNNAQNNNNDNNDNNDNDVNGQDEGDGEGNAEGEGNDNNDDNGNGGSNRNLEDYGLLALQNRPPWWNIELGAFVLNFGGRVSVASVKNFQLCDRHDHDYIMLQFGRIQGRHSFTMDFQYPLTAVQAFAIAISSLQSKISFG